MMKALMLPCAALLLLPPEIPAQPAGTDTIPSAVLDGLTFRSIGPAFTSGRVVDFAVTPGNRSRYYVATASGGVWKTINAGTTWEPVFDDQGSFATGCITMDPSNPSVLWVGSGENNSQRSVSCGDGVYKTEDGGKHWTNMGLRSSRHIGRIVVDPRNPNIVYVAAMGSLWGPGGERGLYKTTDGGATWRASLTVSEHTGVVDVVMDPRNPDLLFAASYQRRRHVWTIIDGGPESAMYASRDGGASWKKLGNGLPDGDVGRIGLAISPVNPDIVFATVEAPSKKGGFYRSTDRGATWEKRSDYFARSAQYYAEIVPDPKDVDRVYAMDTYFMVTDDGGKSFHRLGELHKHVDNHAIWIDPDNTDYYLVGCDGGVYESFDRAATWHFKANLPIPQFYRVTVDNALPFYNIYGGTQDNCSFGGPSRTLNISGIANQDWFMTVEGDGFTTQVDPKDPNIVYSQAQYAGIARYDRRTGEMMGIRPVENKGEEPYRWNWDSPLLISPHAHTRLYFGANILFRSDDRGDSWRAVSGDLTRRIDRNTLPVMGRVWSVDAIARGASTSYYGNIVSITESPVHEGLICVGTDDGLMQVTENGGGQWRKIDAFPGVPEGTYVSRVLASRHDAATIYAAFDNHKNDDFRPYILKSTDTGKTWRSVRGNLPEGTVYAIAEDHKDRNLLFVGTEFGVYGSVNGGRSWNRMKGGLPTIQVRDIAIQERENDLVLGTFGRGFYVLDDYSPLRQLTSGTLSEEGHLFAVKDAPMFLPSRPFGLRDKAFFGESFYTAPNPPCGAVITYMLKDGFKTKKEIRQEVEQETIKKGNVPAFPTVEELRAEDNEVPPTIVLTITDEGGGVVRRVAGPVTKGLHRAVWDFRYPASVPARLTPPDGDLFSEPDQGPLAAPGTYAVRLAAVVDGVEKELAGPVKFAIAPLNNAALPVGDRAATLAFQQKVALLQRAVQGASHLIDDLKERIALIRKALTDAPSAPPALMAQARTLEGEIVKVIRRLRGDGSLRSRGENTPPSVTERVDNIISDEVFSTAAPTHTQEGSYSAAADEFAPVLADLRRLADVDMKALDAALESAHAPWTPGRVPEWKRE